MTDYIAYQNVPRRAVADAWLNAAEYGDLDTLKELRKSQAFIRSFLTPPLSGWGQDLPPSYRMMDGNYLNGEALALACKNGHLPIVQYLTLGDGMIVWDYISNDHYWKQGMKSRDHYVNYKQNLPLYLAAENGHFPIVKFLIDIGANTGEHSNSLLSSACKGGNLNAVKYVLEKASQNYDHAEGMHSASSFGHLNIVKYFVEDLGFMTSIASAITGGHLNIIKYLVKHGAGINSEHSMHLYWAAYHGHLDIAIYLMENEIKLSKHEIQSLLGLMETFKRIIDNDPNLRSIVGESKYEKVDIEIIEQIYYHVMHYIHPLM